MPDVDVYIQTTPIDVFVNTDPTVLVTPSTAGVQGPGVPVIVSGQNLGLSFSKEVPSGIDYFSIVYPSPFLNTPSVILGLELPSSGSLYEYGIRNKTSAGFDVVFSDIIRESGLILNITAMVQASATGYNDTGFAQSGYVLRSETGQFYSSSNPSGFITGVNLTSYITTGQTGAFYPTTNPSGYITTGQTGAFGGGTITNVVYTTGAQTISGAKTFTDQIYTMGSVIVDGTGFLEFAASAPAWKEGRVFYDSGSHCLCYYNNSSQVTVNLGQEQIFSAVNGESNTLLNGTIVYVSGARGNQPSIYRASNDFVFDNADRTVGMVTQDITTNQQGYVTTFGLVHDLDTRLFDEGMVFYLGTGGQPTIIQPTPPNHVVEMGWVLRQHSNQGVVFVSVNKWNELEELCNVLVSGIQSGQSLIYNSAKSVWENQYVVLPSQTGSFVTSGQTGAFYPITNPSGYITGVNLTSYITTGQTGAFYPTTNPSGYITGVNLTSYITTGQTGAFYPSSNPSGYLTSAQAGGVSSIQVTGNNISGVVTLLGAGINSIYTSGSTVIVSGNSSSFVTTGQTGAFYPTTNPSGYITGVNLTSYITTGQTGAFVTTGQTGVYANASQLGGQNGSYYLNYANMTGSVAGTGSFITSGQTGAFYATSNPAAYITASALTPYVQTGQTGAFITSGQTGAFYAASNPAAYITASALTPYVQTGQTGAFASTGWVDQYYYPRTNPSGYGAGGSGSAGVDLTTNQTIGGTKNFTGILQWSGQTLLTGSTANFVTISQTGSFVVSGASIPSGAVLFKNDSVISGEQSFRWDLTNDTLIIGQSGTNPISLPNNPLNIGGSGNTYVQVNLQNRASGVSAQSDYILTADIGSDTNYFADYGINNSGFADTGYALYKALDAFLYNKGGDMWLGAAISGKKVNIHVGMASGDTVATFSASGINLPVGRNYYVNGVAVSGGGGGLTQQQIMAISSLRF